MTKKQSEIQTRVADFERSCRQKGLKVTHQRTEVFRQLAASTSHPDAETVFSEVRLRIPAISLDTVYRTLAWLSEHGFARPAGTAVGPTRYDGDLTVHHHFVCRRCGSVQDFHSPALDALPLPGNVAQLGRIESAHVQVLGICASCADSDNRVILQTLVPIAQ